MNIVIAGQNPMNQCLEAELRAAGFTATLISEIAAIQSVHGEIGAFRINAQGVGARTTTITAEWVIITEEPKLEKGLNDAPLINAPYDSLLDVTIPAKVPASPRPIVILLDYPIESPAFMTRVALEKAIQLARKQRQVLYLAKFMRTVGLELETLYQEARQAGVTFLKYQEVAIESDEANRLHLQITGDSQSLVVKPGELVVADRLTADAGLQKCAGLFRLKLSAQDPFYGNEPFLYPTLTSRRGISILRTVRGIGVKIDTLTQIRSIITEIKNAMAEIPNQKHAEIDSKKCAFCYNCYRACPHAAMIPDHVNSVMGNLKEACHGCGICYAVCPAAAIKITGRDSLLTETSKSLLIFCCENSGAIALKEIAAKFQEDLDRISVQPISCGGEFSLGTLYSALQSHQKVLVLTCMDGACQHFEGNRRAARLVAKAQEQLKAANLDENRVHHAQISLGMAGVVSELIKEQL